MCDTRVRGYPSPVFAILVVCALLSPVPADETAASWLAQLDGPTWAQRDLAQRRLAGLLGARDEGLVRAALAAGGTEARVRLAHVLGGEDRLLGMAADLAVDGDEAVARAGRTALRLAIERFEPWARDEPLERDELRAALAEHSGVPLDTARPGAEPLSAGELADLLARAQPGAPPIVLAPEVAGAAAPGRERGADPWSDLTRRVALLANGRLLGFGPRREPTPAAVRWLVVVPRELSSADCTPAALVSGWCELFTRDRTPHPATGEESEQRAAAARALAALGWTPILDWLGRAWLDADDAAAFEGVLLAARRGRPPACIQEPAARAKLWDALDRRLESGERRPLHVALALAAAGPPSGATADVDSELARALAGLDPASPARAYMHLVVLEGWGGPGAERAFDSGVRDLLERADISPALRFQALRVASRAGTTIPPLRAADAQALLAHALAARLLDELARLLRGAEGWPPEVWADPATDGLLIATEVAVVLADAWLARGREDAAQRYLARLLDDAEQGPQRVAALLSVHPLSRLRPAVDRAVAGRDAGSADMVRVACRVASPPERVRVLEILLARPPASPEEWSAMAALCAGSTGPQATERLVEVLESAPPTVVVPALLNVVRGLRAALDETSEREFVQAVRGAVRSKPGSPLDAALRPQVWPPPRETPARNLRELDRDPGIGSR